MLDPNITNLNQLPSGGGTINNTIPSVQTPDPYFGAGGGASIPTLTGIGEPQKAIEDPNNPGSLMPIYNKGEESFGNIMQATPSTGGGPSLTQTTDPVRQAYDKLQADVKEQRRLNPYTRDVKYGENMTFEDFKKSYDAGTDPNQPTYSGPQLQGQLQSSGGNLMGALGGFNVQKPVLSIGNTGQNRSPFARGGLAKILEV